MASLITHLLIGKYVFKQLYRKDETIPDYSAFLLGCLLVDVHRFSSYDRFQTHFVKRIEDDGRKALNSGCKNFLNQLDTILIRPMKELSKVEQAFVAGYLCHLAVDEIWREFGWRLFNTLKASSLPESPVSGCVMLTAYDIICKQEFTDFETVAPVLDCISIPDVMTNVPHDSFRRMWDIIKPHIMDGHTSESYFQMLLRSGATNMELERTRREHDIYLKEALAVIHKANGKGSFFRACIERSLEVIPQLWKT